MIVMSGINGGPIIKTRAVAHFGIRCCPNQGRNIGVEGGGWRIVMSLFCVCRPAEPVGFILHLVEAESDEDTQEMALVHNSHR